MDLSFIEYSIPKIKSDVLATNKFIEKTCHFSLLDIQYLPYPN